MRIPPGASFLLMGSGIYWILSSQLISSFTVLFPELFQSTASGQRLITVVGIFCVAIGLWTVNIDFEEFRNLANSRRGYVYVLPIAFVALDLLSTLVSLSLNPGTTELNPFVASALQYGFAALAPFLISYLALSQGLAILMLRIGSWLFGKSSWMSILPFSLVLGISSFGPLSNSIGMTLSYEGWNVYALAGVGSITLTFVIAKLLKTATTLRPAHLL